MSAAEQKANDRPRRDRLTRREHEIISLLAEGMSGAQIASKLFLSPETVRTHIRNAMRKLGASTRSQAVVMALQGGGMASERTDRPPRPRKPAVARSSSPNGSADLERALSGMLDSLCSMPDIDDGLVLLAEEDGLTLRRVAVAHDNGLAAEVPERVPLGQGPLGKVALSRRAALLSGLGPRSSFSGAALAAPILAEGRLLGVLGLTTRSSRPTGQSELLVLQALVNRIGEIIGSGEEIDRRLERTAERFEASWTAATS